MNYDITFCNRECENKKCERNFKYVDIMDLASVKPYVSIASFDECEDFKDGQTRKTRIS